YLWELLSAEEVKAAGDDLIAGVARHYNIPAPQITANDLAGFIRAWEDLLLSLIDANCNQR
ncbi:MAG TPA: hypothetical protein VN521_10180, partial [Negativicutes bacterium]|nr:hypothetical protein [Negativicutes bacterium]